MYNILWVKKWCDSMGYHREGVELGFAYSRFIRLLIVSRAIQDNYSSITMGAITSIVDDFSQKIYKYFSWCTTRKNIQKNLVPIRRANEIGIKNVII